MVDYQLEALSDSPTSKAIDELIKEQINHPDLQGKSKPSIKKQQILRNLLVNFGVMQTQGYELLVFPMGRRNFVKSRYLPHYYTPKLAVAVVHLLKSLEIIKILPSDNKLIRIKNSFGGEGTCVIPQATRLELLIEIDIPKLITVKRPRAEIVILKSSKSDKIYSEDLVDYTDRSELGKEVLTVHRPALKAINAFLENHEITYSGTKRCNRTNVSYHRVFNNSSLKYGGRYFGHYIQTLPKSERNLITIKGESITNVDYSGMHYNLLRFKDGATTEMEGDPFTIAGYEKYRDEFKMLAYTLLNATKKLSHPPEDLKQRLIDKGWTDTFLNFKKILIANCPLIGRYEGQGIGLELMNLESQIMTKAMEYLMEVHQCGFVCMHDGLLVPTSKTSGAEAVMSRAFREIVGYFPHIKTTQH